MSPTDMRCKRGVSSGFLAGDPATTTAPSLSWKPATPPCRPGTNHTAWGAKYPAYLAVVHERADDVTAACAMARQAANIVRRTGPSLAQRLALQVHANLAARHPGDPRVTNLGDALHTA